MTLRKMLSFAASLMLAALLATLLATAAVAAEGDPAPAGLPTLEGLLTAAELPFVKTKNNEYKVVYTKDGSVTTLYMKEDAVGSLPEDQLVYLYTLVMQLPNGDPTPLLAKMAEYNDSLLVGRVSVNNGNIFYTSSFWRRNADVTTLEEEIIVAHYTWQEAEELFKEVLSPPAQ